MGELPLRLHELPPAGTALRVADVGDSAREASAFLRGRLAELSPFEWSGEPYRPMRLWSPNPLIEQVAGSCPAGYAVDLGCGTGRDAVFLAACGWDALAVDCLPDAVERGQLTEKRLLGEQGPKIAWRVGDAAEVEIPSHDLLVLLRFLNPIAFRNALPFLRPGGIVVLETYTPTHRERTGKPREPRLVLDTIGARELLPDFKFICLEETDEGPRHILRVLAAKPK